jgi:uncharacterized protein (TIGR00725 family)
VPAGRAPEDAAPSRPRDAPYVAVVGPGAAAETALAHALEIGERLARAGAVVLCGGLGGVMEAACRGAHRAGGMTVGLLPGTERADGNAYLSVAIATGLGELRNGLLVRAADAVIGVGAGWGTLSELALARRTGTPVVLLGSWRVRGDGADNGDLGVRARSPRRAVELALALAEPPRRAPVRRASGA